MANTRRNRSRKQRGGASKRLLCDCQEVGAGGRRFSAGDVGAGINMAALTIPAFKGAKGTKRAMTNKAKAWQNLVRHAWNNLRKNNPAATRANAMVRAKQMRNTGTVPADLAAAAVVAAANVGVGNANTRKAQRNIERAEKAAAAAAAKAEKAAAAAASKATKNQNRVAKAQAAANAKAARAQAAANAKAAREQEKAAKEQEKAAAKAAKEAAAREKAEATAAAAAARLAALQAKLGLGTRQ